MIEATRHDTFLEAKHMQLTPRLCSLVLAVALTTLLGGKSIAVTVYDPAAEFSATNNPNGVWSYGYSTALGGPVLPDLFASSVGDIDAWGTSAGSLTPGVFHNHGATVNTIYTLNVDPGELVMHPGPNGEYSDVRFTAPEAGLFEVSGAFRGVDFAQMASTDVHVLRNGTSLYDGSINHTYHLNSFFDVFVQLDLGDVVDFAVGYGSNGNYYYDSTALGAKVTQVPEPGSVAMLLGCGVCGTLFGFRARRARKA